MEEIKCICGVLIPQAVGKKRKVYCSSKCRQKDWQDKRRKVFEEISKKVAQTAIHPKTYQSAKFDNKTGSLEVVTHKVAPPPVTVTIAPKKAVTFREYLEMAQTTTDKDAFWRTVQADKSITPNQKSMIFSKIPKND